MRKKRATSETAKHIAIAAHILYYQLSPLSIQPLAQTLLDIAKAYNTRSSITVNGNTYNYTSATGKVEFFISGHTHADGNYTINDIPCIVTMNARPTNGIATFDLIAVDYDNQVINCIRVGNGNDRTINM